jgi:hypothetical protein
MTGLHITVYCVTEEGGAFQGGSPWGKVLSEKDARAAVKRQAEAAALRRCRRSEFLEDESEDPLQPYPESRC